MTAVDFRYSSLECMQAMADTSTELATRQAWKFACENRVTGTPTMHVNGVVFSAPFDDADWQDFID